MQDYRVLLRVLWLLAKLAVLQRFLSLPDLVRSFDAKSDAEDERSVELHRLIWLTRGVLRCIYRRHFCLQQSLVLFYFLRKQGYPVFIHIGAAKKGEELIGHAWLELNNQLLAEARDPRQVYKVTFSYPSAPFPHP